MSAPNPSAPPAMQFRWTVGPATPQGTTIVDEQTGQVIAYVCNTPHSAWNLALIVQAPNMLHGITRTREHLRESPCRDAGPTQALRRLLRNIWDAATAPMRHTA